MSENIGISEFDNTNRGVLFKNNKKTEGSNQPDYNGNINVDGVEKDIAAWIKHSDKVGNYLSISVSEKWQPEQQSEGQQQGNDNFVDDDIPF